MDHALAQFNMIEQQIRPWDVLDIHVLDTLAKVPRHHFVPTAYQKIAYSDLEVPLLDGQKMLEPKVAGRLLQALDLQPTDKALEIGTGSGYLTALMAQLADTVTSVEQSAILHEQARHTLHHLGMHNLHLHHANAAQGWTDGNRYHAIVLTGAVAEPPQAYLEQLALGGRLVAVIGQAPSMQAIVFTRIEHQQWSQESLFETQLGYLHGAEAKTTFAF
jgi:protein-L-isoaspartate(D-aspartate) O-methyltransferase